MVIKSVSNRMRVFFFFNHPDWRREWYLHCCKPPSPASDKIFWLLSLPSPLTWGRKHNQTISAAAESAAESRADRPLGLSARDSWPVSAQLFLSPVKPLRAFLKPANHVGRRPCSSLIFLCNVTPITRNVTRAPPPLPSRCTGFLQPVDHMLVACPAAASVFCCNVTPVTRHVSHESPPCYSRSCLPPGPARLRPRRHGLDRPFRRSVRHTPVCEKWSRDHVGGGQALRARGQGWQL